MNTPNKIKNIAWALNPKKWFLKKRRQFSLFRMYWRQATSRALKIRVLSSYFRVSADLLVLMAFLISFIAQPLVLLLSNPQKAAALAQGPLSATASGDCVNDATVGTVAWTTPGNAFSNNATYASVSVDGTISNYIKCTNFGFTLPTGSDVTVNGIVVTAERKASGANNGGAADSSVRVVKGGTIGSTNRATTTEYTLADLSEDHGSTTDLWGDSWTPSEINSSTFGAAFAATKGLGAGAAITVTVDHITITVTYSILVDPPKLAMTGYIWENEDGPAADTASQLAIGSASISAPLGSRMNLRAQIKNTGGSLLSSQNLGLFYDRNDGIWTKVKSATKAVTAAGSGCGASGSTIWTCSVIDNDTADDTGRYTYAAYSPNGILYVTSWDTTLSSVTIAQYVGSGGSGCGATGSTAWTCTKVADHASDVLIPFSMAFNPSGVPYIAYINNTATSLNVAQFVGGTSGTGCGTGSTAWTCTVVDNDAADDTGQEVSIAFHPNGTAYVSYSDTTATSLMVAQYVGSGGTGCGASGSAAWTCTAVDNAAADSTGRYTSLAFSPSGTAYISYFDATATSLKVAQYVGSGGTGCGASGSAAWTCTAVDVDGADDTGRYTSIAFSPNGTPYISYQDATAFSLMVAQYVGSGGTGCGASGSAAWTCTTVDNDTDNTGQTSSIGFGPEGTAYVSYYDLSATSLMVAQYVGSGGTGCGASGSAAWTCTTVDNAAADSTGFESSIAFSPGGTPYVSYYDGTATRLKVASIERSGEIITAPAQRLTTGDVISESHSDMTALPDNTNRDDADCIGGGTWNNGRYFEAEEGNGLSIAVGSVTAQCSEVMFSVDLSQATAGTTYRFMIATNDTVRLDRGKWRGPISVTSGAYPTLTVTDISFVAAKNNSLRMPDCTDTAWGCTTMIENTGPHSQLAFSPSGTAYVSYYNNGTSSLGVAQYVGTGGTGCGALGSVAWTCTTVDNDTGITGTHNSIAFTPNGTPYVSYRDEVILGVKIAQYVGSGGTGCGASGSAAWTCTVVDDDTDDTGQVTSLAFSPNGTPYISYRDNTALSLMVAQYVGSGGTGCGTLGSAAWTCTTVHDSANNVGIYNTIAVSPSGTPYISYNDNTASSLMVAQYVGSGGSGCGTGSTAWTCTTVDDEGDGTGFENSIAFSPSGTPYISHHDSTANSIMVAQYVGGSGGTGCGTGGSTAWTCTTVDDNGGTTGDFTSIAFSPSGTPYVSYRDTTASSLKVGWYVGSGGSGCGTGSTAWTCTTVDNTATTGTDTSIAFSPDGTPYVSHYNSNFTTTIVSLHRSTNALNLQNQYSFGTGRNASGSDARYRSTPGRVATANDGTCGGGTADYLGMCALFQSSGDYDTISAQINESPYQTFAMRYDSNTELPLAQWVGNTTLAPSTAGTTADIVLQAYRYGTTNGWETVSSDTATADCTAICSLSGMPAGTPSEYFYLSGGKYWVYFRLYQEASSTSAITLKTDQFKAATNTQKNRNGSFFQDGVRRPLNWR